MGIMYVGPNTYSSSLQTQSRNEALFCVKRGLSTLSTRSHKPHLIRRLSEIIFHETVTRLLIPEKFFQETVTILLGWVDLKRRNGTGVWNTRRPTTDPIWVPGTNLLVLHSLLVMETGCLRRKRRKRSEN